MTSDQSSTATRRKWLPILGHVFKGFEVLALAILGAVFGGVALLMIWALSGIPALLTILFFGAVGLWCLGGSYRAFRNKSRLQGPVTAPARPALPQGGIDYLDRVTRLLPWDPMDPADRLAGDGDDASMHRCAGFLDAMACLHRAGTGGYSHFFLRPLPPAASLHDALALHFRQYAGENDVAPHEKRSIDDWRISTHEVALQRAFIAHVCARWFFVADGTDSDSADPSRTMLTASFICIVEEAMGACQVHAVSIDPPGWYAISWDLIAFERGDRRFLLHFSHDA